jgi:AcrR family transcriptional regulator
MSGLRAKHKADRDGRILDAAAELFREAGYEGAKIEAIAAAAEVSVGTIYNYYRNKSMPGAAWWPSRRAMSAMPSTR